MRKKNLLYENCPFPEELKAWENNYNSKHTNYELNLSKDLNQSQISETHFSVGSIDEIDKITGKIKSTKIVYCNDRAVPKWAEDMSKISRISKYQKKFFKPEDVFGKFKPVRNLDLKEILNDYNCKYDERGDSFYPRDESFN